MVCVSRISNSNYQNDFSKAKSFTPLSFGEKGTVQSEQTAQDDEYVSQNPKKKINKNAIGIIAAIAGTAAVTLGVLSYIHGGKNESANKKFFERMKDGWKELWSPDKNNLADSNKKKREELEQKAWDIILETSNKITEVKGKAEELKKAEQTENQDIIIKAKAAELRAKQELQEAYKTIKDFLDKNDDILHDELVYVISILDGLSSFFM